MSGWRKYGTTIYDEQWSHDDLDLLAWHSGGRWRWCCSSTGGFAPCRLSALLRAEAASRVAVMPPAETTGMGRVGHRWSGISYPMWGWSSRSWVCWRCGARMDLVDGELKYAGKSGRSWHAWGPRQPCLPAPPTWSQLETGTWIGGRGLSVWQVGRQWFWFAPGVDEYQRAPCRLSAMIRAEAAAKSATEPSAEVQP